MATLEAWRIVKARHVDHLFDGEGARLHGGRWNSVGVAVVYAAQSRALALLELLAHLERPALLASYVVARIAFDDALLERLDPAALPAEWRTSPPPRALARFGDDFVRRKERPVLAVPSVLVPSECNYLLDPAHPAFRQFGFGVPESAEQNGRVAPRPIEAA